jgi:hypothetical protein
MQAIEDRLVPCDGLNNYNVFLSRVELELNGGGQFFFAVTHSMLPVGEFAVAIPATGLSMDRMTIDAHDALIDILRQLTFRADKARALHMRNASERSSNDAGADDAIDHDGQPPSSPNATDGNEGEGA